MRLLWSAVGFSLGVILGVEVSDTAPVAAILVSFAGLLFSTVALGFLEVREVVASSAPQVTRVENRRAQAKAAAEARAHVEESSSSSAPEQPRRRVVRAKAKACPHPEVTRQGSNAFIEQIKCKCCDKLLFYKVKDFEA